jgi:hypothetical protein
MLSGTAATLAESVPSFAAGAALWCAALLLTCVPKEFASWIRLVGIIGAILFAITAARILWGEQVLPTASPLPFYAYPFPRPLRPQAAHPTATSQGGLDQQTPKLRSKYSLNFVPECLKVVDTRRA